MKVLSQDDDVTWQDIICPDKKLIFTKVFLQVTPDIDKTIFFPTLYANCVAYVEIHI